MLDLNRIREIEEQIAWIDDATERPWLYEGLPDQTSSSIYWIDLQFEREYLLDSVMEPRILLCEIHSMQIALENQTSTTEIDDLPF